MLGSKSAWSAALLLAVVTCVGAAVPPKPRLLATDREGSPTRALTPAEAKSLSDPLFMLVIQDHPEVTRLADMEKLLQPDAAQRQVFVIHERIRDPRRNTGQGRRSVLTFSGTRNGQVLDNNVMLSVSFNEENFEGRGHPAMPPRIEAWGWDNRHGRYNYYVVDQTLDAGGKPSPSISWQFRGSSDGADELGAADRTGTCMACHVNGAPVMKELFFPWNNWHSTVSGSPATYLQPEAPAAQRWPVAVTPRLKGHLQGAEQLEGMLVASIQQFNARRVAASLRLREAGGTVAIDPQGTWKVGDGRRLLRPLFVTTEFNLISATKKSGLHPLAPGSKTGPAGPIGIPASFFLNAGLIGGGDQFSRLSGLGLQAASRFTAEPAFQLKPEEYKALIDSQQVKLGGTPGDADFAWFVPEPSQVDNDKVSLLLQLGVVPRRFAAAVLAINLENPILSPDRAALLQFVPDEFRFKPSTGMAAGTPAPAADPDLPDGLVARVKAALTGANPPPGSARARLLELLNDPDPVKRLEEQVSAYHDRLLSRLGSSEPAVRRAELVRLYQVAVQRRKAILADPVFKNLDETGPPERSSRLLPLP